MKHILFAILVALATPAFGQITAQVDTALAEVPVNIFPLTDDTDFKSIEGAVAYNATGMALRWHFVTTAGAYTVTSVTPTTGGAYDWTDQGDSGIYTIEIPATDPGSGTIWNDTEGYGWFTGVATGVMPWRGPVILFTKANVSDSLVNGTDKLDVNAAEVGGNTTVPTSMIEMFATDWATAYDGTLNMLNVDISHAGGTAWGSGAITAGSIATDAIGSAEVAASALAAGTEITGLLAAADIQTECEDALELYRLDELLAADSDIDGAAPPTVGSVFHETLTKTTGSFTFDQTTDSLEAIRDFDATIKSDTADAKTASEAAQAVIEDATNGNAAIKTLLTTVAGYFTSNRAEPAQGAPAASTTFLAKLDYLYKFARNKKDASSSEVKYYNDDATTVDHKASVNTSGGTTTVGETATGP